MNKKTNFARYANKLEALDKLNQYDELLNEAHIALIELDSPNDFASDEISALLTNIKDAIYEIKFRSLVA